MGINISKDYISSLGLETVEEAFNLVKTHCFTTIEQKTNADIQLVLSACVVNNLDPRFNEIYADLDSFGNIVPILKIRGWERIADASDRISGIEFIYSDDTKLIGSLSGCSWIECHVYIDGKDRPITSRVWLEERIQLAGSWLTMPNCRLEQAAYISAVRRALGVRGVYDYDENTLAEVMDMSNQPSAGVNYLVEDDSCDHALEEMINIVATDKSSNDDEVQVEKSTENIKLIKARIELLELELEDLSSDSIEYVEAKTSLLKLKKQLTLKLQKPAEEDMALVETSTIINDHQMPAAVVPSVAEKTTSIFRPSARDRSTLNNYKNYVANSGIDSVIQHIESDHSLVKPGLTTWLISQLKAA